MFNLLAQGTVTRRCSKQSAKWGKVFYVLDGLAEDVVDTHLQYLGVFKLRLDFLYWRENNFALTVFVSVLGQCRNISKWNFMAFLCKWPDTKILIVQWRKEKWQRSKQMFFIKIWIYSFAFHHQVTRKLFFSYNNWSAELQQDRLGIYECGSGGTQKIQAKAVILCLAELRGNLCCNFLTFFSPVF